MLKTHRMIADRSLSFVIALFAFRGAMFLLLIDLASTRFVTTYYCHVVDVLPSWIGAGNPPVDVSQAKTVTHESMPANRPTVYFFFGLA